MSDMLFSTNNCGSKEIKIKLIKMHPSKYKRFYLVGMDP